MSGEEILNLRKNKFLKIGRNKGFIDNLEKLSSLNAHTNNLIDKFRTNKLIILSIGTVIISFLIYLVFL